MQKKSIYKYASEAGVPVGLYLSAMSGCLLFSIHAPLLSTVLWLLAIGFPVILWYQLKGIVKAEPAYGKFSSLWLGGLYTVIFGTLICLFLSALYVVFVEPNFVNLFIGNAVAAAETASLGPDYDEMISVMRQAMEAKILPTGMQFLTSMAWFTCFIGSVISLLMALIMSRTGKKETRQFPV